MAPDRTFHPFTMHPEIGLRDRDGITEQNFGFSRHFQPHKGSRPPEEGRRPIGLIGAMLHPESQDLGAIFRVFKFVFQNETSSGQQARTMADALEGRNGSRTATIV